MVSQDLANRGISADLAVHYAKAGWLARVYWNSVEFDGPGYAGSG